MHVNSFLSVPLPVDLVSELLRRYPHGFATVLEEVTRQFIDRTADDFAPQSRDNGGFQWDSLLLPNGTQVRTKYYGEYQEAAVVDGSIQWEGETYRSMSRLASAMRGDTSNNAWKVLEVKRPHDAQWQPADHLRR